MIVNARNFAYRAMARKRTLTLLIVRGVSAQKLLDFPQGLFEIGSIEVVPNACTDE